MIDVFHHGIWGIYKPVWSVGKAIVPSSLPLQLERSRVSLRIRKDLGQDRGCWCLGEGMGLKGSKRASENTIFNQHYSTTFALLGRDVTWNPEWNSGTSTCSSSWDWYDLDATFTPQELLGKHGGPFFHAKQAGWPAKFKQKDGHTLSYVHVYIYIYTTHIYIYTVYV